MHFLQKMVHQVQQPSSPAKPKDYKPQLWKMTCLRPAPPSRTHLTQFESVGNKRNSINAKPPAKKGKIFFFSLHKICIQWFVFQLQNLRQITKKRCKFWGSLKLIVHSRPLQISKGILFPHLRHQVSLFWLFFTVTTYYQNSINDGTVGNIVIFWLIAKSRILFKAQKSWFFFENLAPF